MSTTTLQTNSLINLKLNSNHSSYTYLHPKSPTDFLLRGYDRLGQESQETMLSRCPGDKMEGLVP